MAGDWILHSLNQNKDIVHCFFRSDNNKFMKDGSLEANISCHYIHIFFAVLRRAKYPTRYCVICTQAHFYATRIKITYALLLPSRCGCPCWRLYFSFPTEVVSCTFSVSRNIQFFNFLFTYYVNNLKPVQWC